MKSMTKAGKSKEKGNNGGSSMRNVLRIRNFRLLWIGENISLLGDQFYMIALPWLVLQLTDGDALATGTVLAVAGIPRALFILIGGAITDRFAPRSIMLASNILRGVLVGFMATLVLGNLIELWMLYVFALLFGLMDAFFFPAQSAMVPQIVGKEDLQAGNSLVQGTAQLSLFAGPILAGFMIAMLGDSTEVIVDGVIETVPNIAGLGIAFVVDASTFLVSAIALWMMRIEHVERKHQETEQSESVLSSIRAGMANVWNDMTMRIIFFIVVAINFFFNGPITVGIPILSDTRFPEGAAAFGMIFAAFGAGALIGIVLAGVLPKPAPHRLGITLMLMVSIMGFGLASYGFIYSTILAIVVAVIIGVANGYINIFYITWLQGRTPTEMLGRVMSLVMFASVGLSPISNALAGAFIDLNDTLLFAVAGGSLVLVAFLATLTPAARNMGLELEEMQEMTVADNIRKTGEMPITGD
jgi:MFS family permease